MSAGSAPRAAGGEPRPRRGGADGRRPLSAPRAARSDAAADGGTEGRSPACGTAEDLRRLLVAGMGNVLRGDDGFGVRVAERAAERRWGDDRLRVEVTEVGIGGLHLVQRLQEGYDGLVIVDAVDRGAEPGRLFLLEPRVPDTREMEPDSLRAAVAGTHHTVPARVLVMARALGALPTHVLILGCQPEVTEALSLELSSAVAGAVPRALQRLGELIEGFRLLGRFPLEGIAARADGLPEVAP